jgi:hypothetical protein
MEDYLFNQHISRLEKDIKGREPDDPWHRELTKVDLKNIASLREARIPEYGDHCVWGEGVQMFEFDDLK